MKRTVFLLLLLSGVFSSYAQVAQISGIAQKDKLEEIRLYQVENGTLKEIARTQIATDGYYGFLFDPAVAGYYVIGDEKANQHRLYIQPGDKAELNIWEERVELTKNNTRENKLLYEWEALAGMLKEYALDYYSKHIEFDFKHFFPYFTALLPEINRFKENIKSKNKHFEQLLKETIDFDTEYYALRFLKSIKIDFALRVTPNTPVGSFPKKKDYPEYYFTLVKLDKFSDTEVLRQPYGVDFISRYADFAASMEEKPSSLENKLTYVANDQLKAELVLLQLPGFKSYEQVEIMEEKYGSLFTEPAHRKRIDQAIARLYQAETGKAAANFTYPDRSGKLVSLSDFRGKVVVVDVWAHWCGPCRAQIPALKKLEEEMHGKDVVFIGVSVDEKKDYHKWEEALDKEGLGGIQLFASGWSKITKDYKITGIPRFMVFDRKGNVVNATAPRPSDPALKRLLEKELKK